MQIGQELVSAASGSIHSKPSSLRHFGRFGAIALGVIAGSVASTNNINSREAAFKAKISKYEAEIAQLKSANRNLEMEKSGMSKKASSGDPIQDWVDSLNE